MHFLAFGEFLAELCTRYKEIIDRNKIKQKLSRKTETNILGIAKYVLWFVFIMVVALVIFLSWFFQWCSFAFVVRFTVAFGLFILISTLCRLLLLFTFFYFISLVINIWAFLLSQVKLVTFLQRLKVLENEY